MSTPAAVGADRSPPGASTFRTTAAAGGLLVGGLAAAESGAGGAAVALALTGAGAVLSLFVLGPAARDAVRRRPVLLLLAALAASSPLAFVVLGVVPGAHGAGTLAGWWENAWVAFFTLLPFAIVVAAGTAGLVLLADDLRARLGLGAARRTPWQRLTGAPGASGPSAGRALAGVGLIGLAGVLGLTLVGTAVGGGSPAAAVAVLVLVGGGVAVLIVAPLAVAGLARQDQDRVTAVREDERQRVAAHLHDSVLQTLALVQRQAHDPAAVARLARRQEHALRAWLAGEAEPGAGTLAAALRAAADEVEDDHGAAVELTVLGDRPLDPPTEALAAAAREALRNAARHARGAQVFVFASVAEDGTTEVFVRDDGPGFVLDEVPRERRGVRDAIIGRMSAAGGTAKVESVPGEGTEVVLRAGGPAAA